MSRETKRAAASLSTMIPKGLPPVSHPFEGDGKACAYCEGPREVHQLVCTCLHDRFQSWHGPNCPARI